MDILTKCLVWEVDLWTKFTVCKLCGRVMCHGLKGCRHPTCWADCESIMIQFAQLDVCDKCLVGETEQATVKHLRKKPNGKKRRRK